MINLKKHDNVADAVKDILQQEALKGNQDKIDANHNGKIDAQDFKILRAKKKKVEEEDTKVMHVHHKGEKIGETGIDSEASPGNGKWFAKHYKSKMDSVGHDSRKEAEAEVRYAHGIKEEAERTEDSLDGKPKAKKGDDIGPGADGKSSKVKLKSEEAEQIDELSKDAESLEEKNWIAGAIKKPGAETAAAKKAGMSVQAYAEKHKHDSGKAGKRARLALTLKHMKEKFEEPILDELINEVMSKDASAGDWIHDFVHSDNPKFAGKSKAKRKEMALAAYYSKKNEEAVNEGLKDMAKKTFKALTGGSDKDHLDRLKKDMYGGSEVKYAAKTLVKHAKDPLGLKKEEVEQAEAESLIENFEMISEVSLGAKIKAYASHSSDAFEHGDMGNDEESEHHNARAEKIHAHILKHHGVEAANHAEKAATSAIFGNGKHKSIDSLSGGLRGQHSKSVTKSGKIPKNTQSAMKNSVKGSYGKRIVGPKGHLPEEVEEVEENWDDMVKAAQEKVKSGPKPSGGSGKKEGSRYGGSKQKDKPEQEDVKEAKNPMMDAGVGAEPNFSTDAAKPMKVAQTMAKKSLAKMRSDMMGKSGK